MSTTTTVIRRIVTIMILSVLLPAALRPHCDTMDGPVVTAAREALRTGNVNLVLIWVQKGDEAAIREAFTQTLAVRKLSPDAAALADMHFFETLVRIHRAGEGMSYTGLKAADTAIEPGIEAADDAVASGSADAVLAHLDEAIHRSIHARHQEVMQRKTFASDAVDAGREYVQAYVTFIHYVERLYGAATLPVEGHEEGAGPSHGH